MNSATGGPFMAWLHFFAAIAAVSAPAIWALRPRAGGIWRGGSILLGALLGLPLFVLLSLLFFLAGLPIRPLALLPIYAAEWSVCFFWRRLMPAESPDPPLSPGHRLVIFYCAFAAILYLLALLQHTSPSTDGAYCWMAKGWTFVQTGDARIFTYTFVPAYPLAVPFGHVYFLLLGSPLGAALWQHLFLIGALLYTLTELARRRSTPGLLVGAAFLVPQMVFLPMAGLSHLMYADTTLAAALLLSAQLLESQLAGARAKFVPAIIIAYFMAMAKINATIYFTVIAAVTAVLHFGSSRSEPPWTKLRSLAWYFGPLAVLIAGWHALGAVLHLPEVNSSLARQSLVNDILSSGAPMRIYAYRLGLSARAFIELLWLDRPFSTEFFLRCGWVFILGAGCLLAWPWLRRDERFFSAVSWAILFSTVAVTFCLIGQSTSLDAKFWFETGYIRAIVHVWPLLIFSFELVLARLAAFCASEWAAGGLPAGVVARLIGSKENRLVLYLLPFTVAPLLFPSGDSSRGWDRLNYHFSTAIVRAPDAEGLYPIETAEGKEFHWTSGRTKISFQHRGRGLVVRYAVAHPDVSPSNPVTIEFLIDGEQRAVAREESRGEFNIEIETDNAKGPIATLEIRLNRTWVDERGRDVGIRVYSVEETSDSAVDAPRNPSRL